MNLLFDQNISPRILKLLPDSLSKSQQVRFLGLENSSDFEIFMFARANNYVVVTFDSDFIDLMTMHGSPPKIIYLNTGNMATKSISNLLLNNVLKIELFIKSEDEDILELLKF